MSISSEISRISGNVSDALDAIADKGVTVPSGSNSDDLADLIAQISGGGTGAFSDVVETLPGGGEHHIITGVDISGDTVTAPHLELGYTAHDADGNPVVGTLTPGGGSANIQPLSVTQNGTYTASGGVDGYSPVTVNVSGGGASNIVMGTFTPNANDAGTAQDISLSYSGSGYPVALFIAPVDGAHDQNGTVYNTLAMYGIVAFSMAKSVITAPTYTPNIGEDDGTTWLKYKNSTSTAYAMTNAGANANYSYNASGATVGNSILSAVFKSATTLSYAVKGSSYGFIPGIEYRYIVLYSQ